MKNMRRRPRSSLGRIIILTTLILQTTDCHESITLPQFQQINGFSSACTSAYSTPIPGCTAADFAPTNPCSSACIAGLQTVSNLINIACKGTSANPTTLIGLFFEDKGVTELCPNAVTTPPGANPPSPASQNTKTQTVQTQNAPSSTPVVITSIPSSTEDTQTTPTTIIVSTSSSSAASTLSSFAAVSSPSSNIGFSLSSSATPSNSASNLNPSSPLITASPINTVQGAGSNFPKTIADKGTALVLTNQAQQTAAAATNADAFGGGGSPFEVSANGVGSLTIAKLSILLGAVGAIMMAQLI